jgi:hypothetical protein
LPLLAPSLGIEAGGPYPRTAKSHVPRRIEIQPAMDQLGGGISPNGAQGPGMRTIATVLLLATCTTADGRQLGDQAWSHARQFIVVWHAESDSSSRSSISKYICVRDPSQRGYCHHQETRLQLCANRFGGLTTSPVGRDVERVLARVHTQGTSAGRAWFYLRMRAGYFNGLVLRAQPLPSYRPLQPRRGWWGESRARVMRRPEPGNVDEGEGTGRSGPSWSLPSAAPPNVAGRRETACACLAWNMRNGLLLAS